MKDLVHGGEQEIDNNLQDSEPMQELEPNVQNMDGTEITDNVSPTNKISLTSIENEEQYSQHLRRKSTMMNASSPRKPEQQDENLFTAKKSPNVSAVNQ